jgi:DnaK suppressor protein
MNLHKQEQALMTLRTDVRANIFQLQGNLNSTLTESGADRESDVPTHEADAGTDTFDRERDDSMLLDFEGKLEEIDRALAKIKEGTYGICDRDGAKISDERLIALPEATLCIDCQAIEEGV